VDTEIGCFLEQEVAQPVVWVTDVVTKFSTLALVVGGFDTTRMVAVYQLPEVNSCGEKRSQRENDKIRLDLDFSEQNSLNSAGNRADLRAPTAAEN
jgi:hypothetical protein